MRVYEPKRDGDLGLLEQPNRVGAVVTRHGAVVAEFDYANEAHAFVQRRGSGFRIHNPALCSKPPNPHTAARGV